MSICDTGKEVFVVLERDEDELFARPVYAGETLEAAQDIQATCQLYGRFSAAYSIVAVPLWKED